MRHKFPDCLAHSQPSTYPLANHDEMRCLLDALQ